MTRWDVLEDLAAFRRSSHVEREALQKALLSKLGPEWTARKLSLSVDALFVAHKRTRLVFAVVPGGRFEMGFCGRDFEAGSEWIEPSSLLDEAIADLRTTAQPVHEVRVRPFLCTRKVLDGTWLRTNGVSTSDRAALRAFAAERGFRLPSEAELEWMLRGGDRHALGLDAGRMMSRESGHDACFGVDGLGLPVWADDDWHANYVGAPADSRPWLDGEPAGVHRGAFATLQGADELAVAFAAKRCRGPSDDGDMYVHWARALDLAAFAREAGSRRPRSTGATRR